MSSELVFEAAGRPVPLRFTVSPQARTMRLRVDRRTGEVVLTVPRRVAPRKALEWAAGHRDWVEAELAKLAPRVPLGPGSTLPLYGRAYAIHWSAEQPRVPRLEPGRLVVGGPAENLEPRLLRWLRRHALDTLAAETAELAAKAGVIVSRVAVGDPRSRWGSCSSGGAIRYSWRLILAPEFVRRATVAHEVAHRVHMDHSPRFHRLVAELLEDDPARARLWLRHEGAALHRIGAL